MRLVVGLGNPGVEYAGTRHNVGVVCVDRIFNSKFEIFNGTYGWRRKKDVFVAEFPDLTLIKSAGVFMNESGRMIQALPQGVIPTKQSARRDPLISREERDSSTSPSTLRSANGMTTENQLYVIHDDLDIKLGEYKIQFGVGPKVHGGLLSIERELKTKEFWRVRIGIDNRGKPSYAEASEGEKYVLQRFSLEERKVVEGVVEKIIGDLTK